MALDAITKWKIADAVFLSGRQHFSPSQKVVFFFQLLCFMQLSRFSFKDRKKCFLWKQDQTPGRSYQVSGYTRPQLAENTAFTVGILQQKQLWVPEPKQKKIYAPVPAQHPWTHTVSYHSMSDIQPYAERSVTRARWKPSWLQMSTRFLYF